MTSDAGDIIRPNKDGAEKAMILALNDAKINSSEIGYINAHGTGTILNDKTESLAINEVFNGMSNPPLVSSTKSLHGHLIGGAGAIELVSCLMSLNDGIIPPTINFEEKDPECDLNLVVNTSKEKRVEYTLSNAFAFGGTNSVLVIKKI